MAPRGRLTGNFQVGGELQYLPRRRHSGGVASISFATLDGSATNGTLSNTNLTFAHSNGLTALARSTAEKSAGKYYFEVTCVVVGTQNSCIAVITPAATDSGVVNSGLSGGILYQGLSGKIFSNDVASGFTLGANLATGDILGVACDLDNHKIWFRESPSGLWNGVAIGSSNPVGAVGGASLSNYSATTMAPAVGFNTSSPVGATWTVNFGQSTFSGSVPIGFVAGWPV